MGLLPSRKEKAKKLDDELNDFDSELLYKRALKSVYDGAKSTNAQFAEFLVLHHDLQEIKKAIEKKK